MLASTGTLIIDARTVGSISTPWIRCLTGTVGQLRAFADRGEEEFLDAAERWIVDDWGVTGEIWRWDEEPRKGRFSDRSLSSMHSQGSQPTLERFHTYLEWYAMWCATGGRSCYRALVL